MFSQSFCCASRFVKHRIQTRLQLILGKFSYLCAAVELRISFGLHNALIHTIGTLFALTCAFFSLLLVWRSVRSTWNPPAHANGRGQGRAGPGLSIRPNLPCRPPRDPPRQPASRSFDTFSIPSFSSHNVYFPPLQGPKTRPQTACRPQSWLPKSTFWHFSVVLVYFVFGVAFRLSFWKV